MHNAIHEELLKYAVMRLQDIGHSQGVACKICKGDTELFDVVDFGKSCDETQYPHGLLGVPIFYRRCPNCYLIFTDFFDKFEADQWRRYIYNDFYTSVDPDYQVNRPLRNAIEIESILIGQRKNVVALDYGGGNGYTATILRERGWVYDSYDPFGSKHLGTDRIGKYNFCSAFEVFEHSPDPVATLRDILTMACPDRLIILIGTGINDYDSGPKKRLSWWYAAPRNGHVSLYSRRSLELLGESCGLKYASVSAGTHLLIRGFTISESRSLLLRGKVIKRIRSTLSRISQ